MNQSHLRHLCSLSSDVRTSSSTSFNRSVPSCGEAKMFLCNSVPLRLCGKEPGVYAARTLLTITVTPSPVSFFPADSLIVLCRRETIPERTCRTDYPGEDKARGSNGGIPQPAGDPVLQETPGRDAG